MRPIQDVAIWSKATDEQTISSVSAWKIPGDALDLAIEFVKAGYLRDHVRVIDTFVDRVDEFAAGEPKMNCQLCKYRTRVIGYEEAVGAPQQGHHHHVRGGGGDHHHDHPHDG